MMISRTETNGKFDQLADLTTELSQFVHGAAQEGKPIHEVERLSTSIFITRAIRWPEFDADDWFWTLFDLLFALVPLVMSVVFWLFAIGLTIATLYMLGNALEVRVTPEEIVSRRRLFGIPLPPRRLATAEITALETEAPLRAGPATKQIKYRSLVAKGPGRRKLALAEGVRDPALLAHLRRSIVRAGRLKLPG